MIWGCILNSKSKQRGVVWNALLTFSRPVSAGLSLKPLTSSLYLTLGVILVGFAQWICP
jgi:hypothetical protein